MCFTVCARQRACTRAFNQPRLFCCGGRVGPGHMPGTLPTCPVKHIPPKLVTAAANAHLRFLILNVSSVYSTYRALVNLRTIARARQPMKHSYSRRGAGSGDGAMGRPAMRGEGSARRAAEPTKTSAHSLPRGREMAMESNLVTTGCRFLPSEPEGSPKALTCCPGRGSWGR